MNDFSKLNSFIIDADFLLQWAGNSLDYPLTEESFRQHIEHILNEPQKGFCFGAYSLVDNQLLGYGEIRGICAKQHTARICRVIVGPEEIRHQGLGRQLVQSLVQIAFEEIGLHRIELEVYDFNHAAQTCYESIGFQHEGVRREAVQFNNNYWSSCIMGLLRHEWKTTNT